MDDLQTVAFESSAYDPVTHWNDRKEKLKEIEVQEEGGHREQYFVEAIPGLSKLQNAETNDAIQNDLQQRSEGPACKRDNLCFIRFRLYLVNEITSYRDQAKCIF